MPTEALKLQAKAEAVYMKYLLDKANKLLEEIKNPILDPQGKVLLEVSLNNNDYDAINKDINQKASNKYNSSLQQLADTLGRAPTPTTTVCLEITNENFNKYPTQITTDDLGKLNNSKSSIIPLQQELYFHLSLSARVYQKYYSKDPKKQISDDQLKTIHQATMEKVNQFVLKEFECALKNAQEEESINLAKLNKNLDKARKNILPIAHTILIEQIAQKSHIEIKELDSKKLKKLAEETTATANDVITFDSTQGFATLITGSDETAHNRKKGGSLADRRIIKHLLDNNSNITSNPHNHIEIRTPSPILKEAPQENPNLGLMIDSKDKIEHIRKKYKLQDLLTKKSNSVPKAFIYNSYTAFNDTLDDSISTNKQTESAIEIIKAIHVYNQKQYKGIDPVLCLVQNISVNGFGDTLGYKSGDELKEETTLMAELSLLHTLYDISNEHEKPLIDSIFGHYQNYLNDSNSNKSQFFSSSGAGHEARNKITKLKEKWKLSQHTQSITSIDLPKYALKKLIAHNLHFSHSYAKLIQALSVYSEEVSLNGCKSGNERTQLINGRVAVLDRELKEDNHNSKIQNKLNAVIQAKNIFKDASQLNKELNTSYDKGTLYGATSLISLLDQGSSFKIGQKLNNWLFDLFGEFVSRNYAEDAAIENLQQNHAAFGQAHKGMSTLMKEASEGHPQAWWDRMKSSPLGVVGAALGVLTIVPAVLVGVLGYLDNQHKKDTFQRNINILAKTQDKQENEANPTSHIVMQQALRPNSQLPETIPPIKTPPSSKKQVIDEHEKRIQFQK